MAHKIKIKQCSSTSFLILLTSFKLVIILVSAKPQVPCYFIFGDSLVDNGNNNMLQTDSKANYPPYGIDFRDGPTGRFTNGRTSADILGELLGFRNYIPPFATARGLKILKGVNYASGGSGIRNETGRNLGEVINLDQQLMDHGTTISNITDLQAHNSSYTKEYMSKCIYTVGMGGNDYKTNYLLPQYYPTSSKYTPAQFAAELIKQYRQQLKTLYNYGARKVVVYGVRPVGCTPQWIAQYGANSSGCVDFINDYVQLFNNKIKPLVDDLNRNLLDAHYIYINVSNFSPPKGLANNYPCCTVSTTTHKGQCVPYWVPCGPRLERASRASWDEIHPTETEHKLIASRSYTALSPFDAYPFDIRHLALL